MIRVYGIKSCDSVKKALKFFKLHGIEVHFTDFREHPLNPKQIAIWAEKSDLKILFNNKSRTYKDLGLSKTDLDDAAKISWMQKEPLLIKRPVIEDGDRLIVGFDEIHYNEVFKL